jgi:alpha-amylase/alpha-mannosidase (GH57 family)
MKILILFILAILQGGTGEKFEGVKLTDEGILFRFYAPEAKSVNLAGTFNNWSTTSTPMKKVEGGYWEVILKLSPGRYEYKYVIDGNLWKEDPANPNKVPDPYGGFNSVLVVKEGEIEGGAIPSFKNLEHTKGGVIFRFYAPEAKSVNLAGTFNNWAPNALPMRRRDKGIWEAVIKLPPGIYQYKFVIDGTKWREDPKNPAKVDDGYGGFNSIFILKENGEIEMKVPEEQGSLPEKEIIDELPPLGNPLYLAIVWHQHQPRYFKDLETGEYYAPWVRLHSIKDYYDMTSILLEYPDIHFTVNLTPSLLMQLEDQIERYERGESPDQYVRLTLKDASRLSEEEKEFLILNFFSASWPNMIDIWQRYRELREKRVTNPDGSINAKESIKRYTVQDFRDLQAWFNLAWFDPDFQEKDVVLITGDTVTVKDLIKKGRNFSEEDKRRIIDIQFKIMKAVIPLHRILQEKGQLEVITTPFYHPILPLIYDTDLAREAMPYIELPRIKFSYPGDAKWHLERAVEKYIQLFGFPPRGMWPSEGSVAQEIIPLVRDAGFIWMASDMQVLARSLKKSLITMEDKYSAYRVSEGGKELYIIFRDTDLSDRIGFRYKSLSGVQAANDLILALYEAHKRFAKEETPYLVPIILDGENAWEWYKHDGKEFFHSLYSQLSRAEWIKTVTVSEFLEKFPPRKKIDHLFAGSWIGADFSTWIGEPEENVAWEYLARVRSDFERAKNSGKYSEEILNRAFLEIAVCEGSDWFWFFGKDQNAPGGDAGSDEMFRRTLKNVYRILGIDPPDFLDIPIIERAIGYVGEGGVMAEGMDILSGTEKIFEMEDKEGDDYGPGNYEYPTDPVFQKGLLDLLKFEIYVGTDKVAFKLIFKKLTNPWNAPLGFSHPLINLYISTGSENLNKSKFPRTNVFRAEFDENYPWDIMLKVAGWQEYGTILYTVDGREERIRVSSNPKERSITFSMPIDLLGNGDPFSKPWAFYLLIFSQDGYSPDHIRPVRSKREQWVFGGAKENSIPVIDMLDPSYNGKSQEEMLSPHGGIPVLYPIVVKIR